MRVWCVVIIVASATNPACSGAGVCAVCMDRRSVFAALLQSWVLLGWGASAAMLVCVMMRATVSAPSV